MPDFNWDSLDSYSAWAQLLRGLLDQGREALQRASETQLDATEADLQAYIAHCQVYGDLRASARTGLGELLARDIAAIIARLRQLPPALANLREQHRRQPFRHARLGQQLEELLATLGELLEPDHLPRRAARLRRARRPGHPPTE